MDCHDNPNQLGSIGPYSINHWSKVCFNGSSGTRLAAGAESLWEDDGTTKKMEVQPGALGYLFVIYDSDVGK